MTIKCNEENFNIPRKMGSLKVGLLFYIGLLGKSQNEGDVCRTKDIERDNHPKFDWLFRYPLPIWTEHLDIHFWSLGGRLRIKTYFWKSLIYVCI